MRIEHFSETGSAKGLVSNVIGKGIAANVHQKEIVADDCYKCREATRLQAAMKQTPWYRINERLHFDC